MKSLEEKRLLVKMTKMLGQPVDPALLASIEKEERLNETLFKKPQEVIVEQPVEILIEAPKPEPAPKPAETNLVPPVESQVQQIANVLRGTSKPPIANLKDQEIAGIRKQLAEMMQKISTLSWGGGGTGVVRIGATDDFDTTSYSEGRYLRWVNGMFRLDEVNPHDVIYNTTLVTSPTYTITADDYYIGVNYAGPCTITLPASPSSGREVAINDESGNAEAYPITVVGNVDNDAGGFILAVNNGAVQLIYRNGWRII